LLLADVASAALLPSQQQQQQQLVQQQVPALPAVQTERAVVIVRAVTQILAELYVM
jgi:hypothetical protein